MGFLPKCSGGSSHSSWHIQPIPNPSLFFGPRHISIAIHISSNDPAVAEAASARMLKDC
jgi:hypothetical protein